MNVMRDRILIDPLISVAERQLVHSVKPSGAAGFQRELGDRELEVAFIVPDGEGGGERVVVVMAAPVAAGLAIHLLSSTTRTLRRKEAEALVALASQVPTLVPA